MVEGTPLLRAQMVMNCLEGSNPFLSATYPKAPEALTTSVFVVFFCCSAHRQKQS